MLEIRDLHVRYGGIQAVQGVSLTIPRGSIVTLIGANGAGKSSIIRSIAGLNKNVNGEILLTRHEGETPSSLMGLKPEDMVRRGISLSPEGRRILPHLTVAENLMLGAYSRNDRQEIADDIEWVYTLFPRLKERNWQKMCIRDSPYGGGYYCRSGNASRSIAFAHSTAAGMAGGYGGVLRRGTSPLAWSGHCLWPGAVSCCGACLLCHGDCGAFQCLRQYRATG